MAVTIALRQAESSCGSGDEQGAVNIATESLRDGAEGLEWVRFALRCRDDGKAATAERVLLEVVRYAPCAPAYYELAFIHRLRGEHREAIRWLRAARAPHDTRLQMSLAHMLHAVGAHPEADAILNSLNLRGAHERAECDAMFAFGGYLKSFPLGRAIDLVDRVANRYPTLDTASLANHLAAAVAQKRPFAMVRLGDGEGGVSRLSPEDEFAHRAVYERTRQELGVMWFGEGFDRRAAGFEDLAATLLDEIRICDVIGLPYESWIRHEYGISSLRGVPSLVNVHRAMLAYDAPGMQACSQRAHIDLHLNGRLAPIIAAARQVSVITCLTELADLLRSRLDLQDVEIHRIPGEQSSRALLGEEASSGAHFPGRFRQLQAELARPHDGRLFLVAGGVLGKFYAATIRRHGGIAIDVGSLVDGWAGRFTRPGYDDRLKL